MSSEKIQLISALVTTAVAVISIFIAVATLRQNSKITEEANRPYVVIYYESIQVTSTPVIYLVVKNFGKTGAIIDSVTYTPSFQNKHEREPFTKLQDHFIAPNQAISTACSLEESNGPVTFTIKYRNRGKTYSEDFTINHQALSANIFAKVSSSNATIEKTISYAAQELIRTNF